MRLEGREPESDLEARLMAMTRPLELSHLMPSQLQKGVLLDQPEGLERALARSDMKEASSAMAKERRESMRKERETRVFSLG